MDSIKEDISEINKKICDHIDVDLLYKQNTLGVNMHLILLYLAPKELKYKEIIEKQVE